MTSPESLTRNATSAMTAAPRSTAVPASHRPPPGAPRHDHEHHGRHRDGEQGRRRQVGDVLCKLAPDDGPGLPRRPRTARTRPGGCATRPGAASRARRRPPPGRRRHHSDQHPPPGEPDPGRRGDDDQAAEQQPGRPPEVGTPGRQRLDRQRDHEHHGSQPGRQAARQTTGPAPGRHPAHDDEHGEPVEREAGVAQPVEPPPDDRVLPEHRAELQGRTREHVPAEHEQRHHGDEPQRPQGRPPLGHHAAA